MKNTYEIINEVLVKTYSGKNLNEVLFEYKKADEISKIKSISYGVIRNSFALDFILKKLIKNPNIGLEIILKIAIFELWQTNKPEYAVINDTVEYVKINISEKVVGFANAVLRNFLRSKQELFEQIEKDYSLKYNLPNWIINKLKKQNKEKYKQILESFILHPAFGIRINNKKISMNDYCKKLSDNKLSYEIYNNKIVLDNPCNVNELPGFISGEVSIQDAGAQYLINILQNNNINPKKVLDACSAPGGKTCQILENYDCNLTAIDIDDKRLIKVQENLDRLNLSAKLLQGDARNKTWWDNHKYDLIIADVPCSATGTIKRNPDIKITRKEDDLLKFVDIQHKIIINLWDMLEKNGYLLYVTCSIFNEENQENLLWILNNCINSEKIEELQVLPSKYNDGLYYVLIKKN